MYMSRTTEIEKNTENTENKQLSSQFNIYNLTTGNIFQTNICSKITDIILILFSICSFGVGCITWVIIDNITGTGYILSGIFSSISLVTIKKMRLRATLQKSVNVLQEENDELKENNDELKENIDDLEVVQKTLSEDLIILKRTIGIFGKNSEEIMNNLKEIYNNLKKENDIQANLNKNSIYLHILHIIRHYDENSDFILTKEDLNKAKTTLLNAFPNLDYNNLTKQIKNNKITASLILENITLL